MTEITSLEKLEFAKILQYIANYSHTENGKQLILSTTPLTNSTAVKKEGELVTQAKEIFNKKCSSSHRIFTGS